MKKRILSAVLVAAMSVGLLTATVSAKNEFVKYDIFDALNFETESYGKWTNGQFDVEGQDDPIKYIQNGEGDYAAQSGIGAVFIGGTGAVSMWGDAGKEGVKPKAGELICGTYWLKVMQQTPGDWKQPRIRIFANRNGKEVDLAITKDLNSFSVWQCPRFKWTQLQLESTGVEYRKGDSLKYEIANNGSALKFMIDNIEIGAHRNTSYDDPEGMIFKKYPMYGFMNFEDSSKFTPGVNYSSNNGSVEFKNNDSAYKAYEGTGAVYIDCAKGGYSFWAGGATPQGAEAGEQMTGYIRFKFMQPHYDAAAVEEKGGKWYKLPQISVVNKTTGEVLCGLNPDDYSILNFDQGVWYKLPLKTTGAAYSASDLIDFEIKNVVGTGIKFMLDDFVLGTYVEDTHGAVNVTAAPRVNSFTDFNSDFENLTVDGAPSNWGQYTPSASDGNGNACEYVVNSDDAYSGTSMLKFVRGGSLWNIQNNVEGKTGKPIGGSYMLYVSDNCNLSYDYPRVYVKYKDENGETIVAESPKNNAAYEVQPGWNKIPILPLAGKVVPEDAANVTLMIESANIIKDGVSNVPYDDYFYLDNINVGTLVEDMYISDESSFDYDGSTMTCKVVISNAKADEYVFGEVIAAIYEDGKLIGVNSVPNAVVARKGSSGYVSSVTDVPVSVQMGDGNLSISMFFWDTLNGMQPLVKKNN